MPDVPIPVRELEFSPSFWEGDAGEGWVWVPDAIDIEIAPRSGEWRETWSCTCFEHLFLLLDRLERETDGWALFGTGLLPVEFADDDDLVTLRGRRYIVGTPSEMRTVVRGLIATVFEKLHALDEPIDGYGETTRDVAQGVADSRFTFHVVDPVAVHDELRA